MQFDWYYYFFNLAGLTVTSLPDWFGLTDGYFVEVILLCHL